VKVKSTRRQLQHIVAGGPISGAIGLTFIIRADSAPEIDEIVGALPLWPPMITTVTPLNHAGTAGRRAPPTPRTIEASK
jgi:hypothetical protein